MVEAPVVYITDAPDSPNFTNVPVVIAVEEGTEVSSSITANAHWVMFGYSESNISETPDYGPGGEFSTFAYLNDQGWQLLDQTVAWALGETTSLADWQVY